MGKFSPQANAPAYMKAFRCIGPDCEEHCCSGWQVGIDKRTYQKYLAVTAAPIKDLLQSSLKRKEGGSFGDYAVIKLKSDGACPMLTEQKLCTIQSQLGADYLSHTCNHYPRQYSKHDQEIWAYATLSCPEAARLALLKPDAMELTTMQLSIPNESALPPHANLNSMAPNAKPLVRHAPAILAVTRQILGAPYLKASEAIIIVGFLVKSLDRLLGAEKIDDAEINKMLYSFTNEAMHREFCAGIQEIEPQRSLQMRLLTEITSFYVGTFGGRQSFSLMLKDALAGIQFESTDLAGSEARYREAEQGWFQPFDDAHPHILRNYLLNDIGKNTFPIGSGEGMQNEFVKMAARLALIRLYLVGHAGLRKAEFSGDDYVKVIYTVVRNIEHNQKFMPGILAMMKEQELDNLATVAIMLR